MPDAESYQIILDPVEDAKQSAVELFLSGCFSLPPASTRRIAASGPIAILSDLDGVQAEIILADLVPSLPEGVSLRAAREGEDDGVSRLEWPRQPKIFGKPLDDFRLLGGGDEAPCPSCGKMLSIRTDAGGGLSVKLVRETGKTLMIPNPASVESDKDPLFSGFKPLAADTASLASMQSLQAGDTGFWGESRAFFPPRYERPPEPVKDPAETNVAARTSTGLAAYMKPGVFAVVIARTKDAPVVKKVAEILGISEDEAREKCLNLSLCVARDISLDEAQTLLARFKTLGAKARIAKPM